MNKSTNPITKEQKISSSQLDKKNNLQNQKDKQLKNKELCLKPINQNKAHKSLPKQTQKQQTTRNNLIMSQISTQRLHRIQSQKQLIQTQLQQINQKIKEIKREQQSNSLLYIRQQISNNAEAKKMAITLVKHHRQRKKQFQQKRRQFQQKLRANLTQECQQERKKRLNLQQAQIQQKRRVISMRMHETKKQRQERQQIDRQSNTLVKQLIREDSQLLLKNQDKLLGQDKYQLKVVQRKPFIDFLDIEKHQSQYLLKKLQNNKRSISISYPIKSYGKNRWAKKLQQIQMKQRQQEERKEIQKKNRIQRKIKYGKLIHSLFVQKKIKTQKSQQQIVKSHSMTNESSQQIQSKNVVKRYKLAKTESIKQLSPQNTEEKDKQLRKQRETSLRNETIKRLKRIQSFDSTRKLVLSPKYQSNYQNYLGKVNIKKRKQSEIWKQIMNSKHLTREQKNTSILKKAVALQNKAKFKQSLKSEQDKVVSLYLDSIEAKLTVLRSM